MKWKKAKRKPTIIKWREVNPPYEIIKTVDNAEICVHPEKSIIALDDKGFPYPINREIFNKIYEVIQ